MGKFGLLLYIFFTAGALHSQSQAEKNARTTATQMLKAFNQKDFDTYIEFLLPSQYGDNSKNKAPFIAMFKNTMAKDTSQMQIRKILKVKRKGEQTQVVFQNEFRQNAGFIVGISNDDGKHWLFTQ